MFNVQNLTAGARGSTRLVHDDLDRSTLVLSLACAFKGALLAYCPMDTHVHALVEGEKTASVTKLDYALRGYAQVRNRREALPELLRGPIDCRTLSPDQRELARAIHYIHQNPVKTTPPIVHEAIHFEWSSARAFGGLVSVPFANVARARELMGREAWRADVSRPPLQDLLAVSTPRVRIHTVLTAVAQVHGFLAVHLASKLQSEDLTAARRTFVRVAHLESYTTSQIAHALKKTRQRVNQLKKPPRGKALDDEAAKMARTLFLVPELRARLEPALVTA